MVHCPEPRGGWPDLPATSVPAPSWTSLHRASGEVTELVYKVLELKAWARPLTGAC